MDHPFRIAAVGGFNKHDVLNFLEEQARQAAQTRQELQDELDGVRRELAALQSEHSELSGQLEQARQELERSGQERAELAACLEQSGRELAGSQKRAGELARELEEAKRELEGIRPDAQAYADVKEHTAGMELDAHRRAKAIQEKAEQDAQKVRCQAEQWLREAERDAQKTRSQTERWLQEVERGYDALCSQMESTVSHAASELEKVGAGLERLNALMDSQGEALEGVIRAYGAAVPDCVEASAPLDEE